MARFDVYQTRPGDFAVDVQADLLSVARTRVVVPLLSGGIAFVSDRLTPTFLIAGQKRVLATHLLFSVQTRRLGRCVENVAHYRDDILRALDMLFTGF